MISAIISASIQTQPADAIDLATKCVHVTSYKFSPKYGTVVKPCNLFLQLWLRPDDGTFSSPFHQFFFFFFLFHFFYYYPPILHGCESLLRSIFANATVVRIFRIKLEFDGKAHVYAIDENNMNDNGVLLFNQDDNIEIVNERRSKFPVSS